tara:strand:- start:1400 stop:2221 length:822 start_codon:yes stop_codon:yes gene_type:complete
MSGCGVMEMLHGPSIDFLMGELLESPAQRHNLAAFDWYEFGLLEGVGTNYSMCMLQQDGMAPHHVFGFDSFQGLPANDKKFKTGDWSSKQRIEKKSGKHDLNRDDVMRIVRDNIEFPKVTLIPGFYNESLQPGLASAHRMRPAFWVNMDADLYVSTMTAYEWLFSNQLMRAGTLVYYDDVWYYPFGTGESQAHEQISRKYGLKWRPRLAMSRDQVNKHSRTWWDPAKYAVHESHPYDFSKSGYSRSIWPRDGSEVGVVLELLTPGPYAPVQSG